MIIQRAQIYGKPNCPFCIAAKNILTTHNISYEYSEVGIDFSREWLLEEFPGAKTYPQIVIVIDDVSFKIGGYTELKEYLKIVDLEYFLRSHVLKIRFVKKDETVRVMVCTLDPSKLPERKQDTLSIVKNKKFNIVRVYDLQKEDWRSFDIDSLIDYEIV